MASGYYDITNKTLGKGHYGVVKLARHCLTGEPVAMKIIEKARLNNDSFNQLGTEIRILFRLSEYEHPNILKLYQTIDTEDKLFLVTEYCGPHACDLHDYLLRKRSRDGLVEKEAQIFFTQICSAISYCHSMGIVHRDLKPENILVTDYKTRTDHKTTQNNEQKQQQQQQQQHYPLLKLIDFGFANQWYPDEKMRTSCGTLAYSAPELLLGEPYDGTKVDVWGLGLMLYILLYGGNPFMQINDNETLTKILDCSFATPIRKNVSQDAIELLRSLIKRNPDTRLPIDAILRHKWFSGVINPIELKMNYKTNQDQSNCSKQLQQTTKTAPVTSPTLPSISESKPLKSFNRSTDDEQQLSPNDHTTELFESILNSNYNRTRSLSITRIHSKPVLQQSLPQTRSSINLGKLFSQKNNSIPSTPSNKNNSNTSLRSPSIYRPTSPDVGGFIVLSEEEKKLHETVIQEMFTLTRTVDSKSSIEASLKNARFSHRSFSENSIQPTQFNKKKTPGQTIAKSLLKLHTNQQQQPPTEQVSDMAANQPRSSISIKLSNDDYIYATYQLTRDRILRLRHEQKRNEQQDSKITTARMDMSGSTTSNRVAIPEEDVHELNETGSEASAAPRGGDEPNLVNISKNIDFNRISAKENDGKVGSRLQQRKLLQPQHKMRDKFTSFFRSGSTSPNNSMNISCDSPNGGAQQPQINLQSQALDSPQSLATLPSSQVHLLATNVDAQQHEAFSDHNNDLSAGAPSSTMGRFFGMKQDSYDNSMAYALPLARKCSLVSEESNCSTDLPDN